MREPRAPRWVASATRALLQASSRIRLIASTTPLNLRGELMRLEARWASGHWEAPQFVYPEPTPHESLIEALRELSSSLRREGELGSVYAERAEELAEEATICSNVGKPGFFEAARRRFSRRDPFDAEADTLALGFLRETIAKEDEERVRSDDESSPYSLVSRMREALGTRKLPFRVVVTHDLSALAATGDSVVQVIAGRELTRSAIERTVLHELEGHVLPRHRASSQRIGIFAVGTRFGVDDQEGRALWIEQRAGHLRGSRKRELGARHLAARSLESGADFVEAGRMLLSHHVSLSDALRIVARVYRGSGLGREVVYLPGYLRVSRALAEDPTLDLVLSKGRVSVRHAPTLRPWVVEEP